MKLHLLRIFTAVADQMSFSKAAERLYISQPAVSKAVSELESQVGQPLFERGSGKLRLTEAGALLAERGRAVLAIERTAEEDLRALRGLQQGILRIGASTTIATYLLPPTIAAFLRTYPGVDLRLTIQNTLSIMKLLLDYQLDVALVEGPVADERISSEAWQLDELVVIAAPAHPLVARAGLTGIPIDLLVEEVFLVREPGSGTREVGEDALLQHGIRLAHTVELGSTEAIKQAVAAGLGLAIISKAAIVDQLALGTLAVLAVQGLTIQRMLTRLRLVGRTPSPAARAFHELLTTGRPT
jgi:DNA-binding transcriptional LysR family regulator